MDIDNNIRVTKLIDVYGELLTDKQLQICQMYYFDNLTLAEIGEVLQISRQAVSDCIEKSTKNLNEFELKIGKIKLIENINNQLKTLAKKYNDNSLTKDISSIIDHME